MKQKDHTQKTLEQHNDIFKEVEDMPIDSWFDQVVPEAEARGEFRGEARVQQLFAAMTEADRTEEFMAVMKDRDLLHELYREFDIDINDVVEREYK